MNFTEKGRLGRLLMNVSRMRAKRADQFMEKCRLYRGQGLLLLFISDNDGLTHSEIAQWLKISPAAATKVIKRLEEQGYLERRPDENDERISRVFICNDGRAVVDEVHQSFVRLDERTFDGFSNEDLGIFGDYLKRIQENLQND
jgi:DNA-binding MarR family transcriptional regulator